MHNSACGKMSPWATHGLFSYGADGAVASGKRTFPLLTRRAYIAYTTTFAKGFSKTTYPQLLLSFLFSGHYVILRNDETLRKLNNIVYVSTQMWARYPYGRLPRNHTEYWYIPRICFIHAPLLEDRVRNYRPHRVQDKCHKINWHEAKISSSGNGSNGVDELKSPL